MIRGALFRFGLGAVVALVGSVASLTPAAVGAADAVGCVRITGGVFDSPSNDNYMPYLNQEFVVIKNVCSTSKLMTGWRVNDYGRIHTYTFPSGYRIGAGVSVKLDLCDCSGTMLARSSNASVLVLSATVRRQSPGHTSL